MTKFPKKRVCVGGGEGWRGGATNKPILSLQSRQYKRSIAKPSEISWLAAFERSLFQVEIKYTVKQM